MAHQLDTSVASLLRLVLASCALPINCRCTGYQISWQHATDTHSPQPPCRALHAVNEWRKTGGVTLVETSLAASRAISAACSPQPHAMSVWRQAAANAAESLNWLESTLHALCTWYTVVGTHLMRCRLNVLDQRINAGVDRAVGHPCGNEQATASAACSSTRASTHPAGQQASACMTHHLYLRPPASSSPA